MSTTRTDLRLHRSLKISLGERVPAITADVSRGGFCARLDPVFFPGSIVHGSIRSRRASIPFKGTVVWAEAGKPKAGRKSLIGVQFTEVAPGFEGLFATGT